MRPQSESLEALRREFIEASPYPGLRPFSSDEARYFKGREKQVAEIITRLTEQNFVAILGGSGCGKSSIVRAGVIPALRLKLVPGRGDFWRVAMFTPGRTPIDNLVRALGGVLAPTQSPDRNQKIRDVVYGPNGLGGFLPRFKDEMTVDLGSFGHKKGDKKPTPDAPCQANILIVVDQFEELFREENRGQAQSATLAQLLIDGWQRRADNPGLYFIITMRTDDLHRCAEFIDLPEVINSTSYLTRRLKEHELREAIVSPVRPAMFRAGLLAGSAPRGSVDLRPLDVQVVSTLLDAVDEIAHDPDHLPLLQHLLAVLWRTAFHRWCKDAESDTAGENLRITTEDLSHTLGFDTWEKVIEDRKQHYDKGVQGWILRQCLEHVADALYQGSSFGAPLTPSQQHIARTAFCLMGEVDDHGNFKRRWTNRKEIAAVAGADGSRTDIEAFVARFTSMHRLLWERATGEMDVTHESLMRNWPRLGRWLAENREAGMAYQRVVERRASQRKEEGGGVGFRSLFRLGSGRLSTEELERIVPLLTRRTGRFIGVEPRYNGYWAQRFAPPKSHADGNKAISERQLSDKPRKDIEFESCYAFLKYQLRLDFVRRHSVTALVLCVLFVTTVAALVFARQQKQIALQEKHFALQQVQMAEQQKKWTEAANNAAALALWSGLSGWEPVPNSVYVKNLWGVATSSAEVRVEFVNQIPPGNVARQMGFRPAPIVRAIGLRWPAQARTIVSDKIKKEFTKGRHGEDEWMESRRACAIAALGNQLSKDVRESSREYYKKYLKNVSLKRADKLWSATRIMACLGPDLPPAARDDALRRIFDRLATVKPTTQGLGLMSVASAAAVVAWTRHPDFQQGDIETFNRVIDAVIPSLAKEPAFRAVILSRSLVTLLAALSDDIQLSALRQLLATASESPNLASDPRIMLILAQSFELFAQNSDLPQNQELNEFLTVAGGANTEEERIGVARLVAPLAQNAAPDSKSAIQEQLLRMAGVPTTQPKAMANLFEALETAVKSVSPHEQTSQNDAVGLRIGLLARLIALRMSVAQESEPNRLNKLLNTVDQVGQLGKDDQPLLGEAAQQFARESLARALLALSRNFDEADRARTMEQAKRALSITGSAEEAAAWALLIKQLVSEKEPKDSIAQIIEVLKYPTAALRAREPNAKEPRDATTILVKALQGPLEFTLEEPLRIAELREVLDRAKAKFPDLDLESVPEKPNGNFASSDYEN